MIKVRPISEDDFAEWLSLWDGNNQGHRDAQVSARTWARLCDADFPVHGLVAEKNGRLVGLVHYITHYTTGHIAPICYMQDVYVDPAQRKQGIARKMIQRLAHIGRTHAWPRIYWMAERDNEAAQNLYKTLGVALDFTLHVLVPK